VFDGFKEVVDKSDAPGERCAIDRSRPLALECQRATGFLKSLPAIDSPVMILNHLLGALASEQFGA